MQSSCPSVSVLMPTYNNAPYLSEAIESILNQSFRDFEFIIIDDGSTDESPEILASFAQKDCRIHILRNDCNLGRAGARNRALWAGPRGEFIAVMDGDDVSLPDRLEKQAAYLEGHPDIVVVGAQVMNVDNRNLATPEQTHLPETHGTLVWTLLYSVPFSNPVVMMRAEAIKKLGGYRESAVEDAELWSRLVYAGRFANLPDILLYYRMPSARRALRMADWAPALLEVGRLFVENLIEETIDIEMSKRIRYSMFHRSGFRLTTADAFQTVLLLQRIFGTMQCKGLLQPHDLEEVAGLMCNQFRALFNYVSDPPLQWSFPSLRASKPGAGKASTISMAATRRRLEQESQA